MIERIYLKLISLSLINDYSLIADLHIFVYGRTECASISLECAKVKLLTLNNFDIETQKSSTDLIQSKMTNFEKKFMLVAIANYCLSFKYSNPRSFETVIF